MLSLLFIWQPIILVLLDITPMMGVLDGVLMELQDCALPLLKDVITTKKRLPSKTWMWPFLWAPCQEGMAWRGKIYSKQM